MKNSQLILRIFKSATSMTLINMLSASLCSTSNMRSISTSPSHKMVYTLSVLIRSPEDNMTSHARKTFHTQQSLLYLGARWDQTSMNILKGNRVPTEKCGQPREQKIQSKRESMWCMSRLSGTIKMNRK